MNVSIIIPTYKSPTLLEAIESVINQSNLIDFEIIVVGVDEMSSMSRYKQVKFVNTEEKCPPAKARNIGSTNSVGEILVFLDSDCVAPIGWLEKLIEPFINSDIIAVGGGVKFFIDKYWVVADNLSMFHSFLWTGDYKKVTQLPSLNLAIRKNHFISINGFDEKFEFPSGEDFEMMTRLSQLGQIIFSPDAWVFHKPQRSNLIALVRHSFLQGKFSTKILYNDKNIISKMLFNRISILFFAVIFALVRTIVIFSNKAALKYFYVFPAIFISKLSWCVGAFFSPWHNKENISDKSNL
ncbi:MAG: hypothetical protein CVU46_00145 [Chloroflexi bacterium HGW-Chloroflexi-8]|nr:MAG: hypothetical protein CVU46_00145 [Chloroflexi bacterium HGW-Chloroflexi-8]